MSRIYEKAVKAATAAAETLKSGKYNYHEVSTNTYRRSSIKAVLNKYLDAPMESLGYKQQMLAYGFLMRSRVLS